MKLKIFLITVALFVVSFGMYGQTAVPNTTAVTQNFDGMAATTTLPTNWRMHASTASPTWAGAATTVTQQASSGSPVTGGTYNFGSSTSERAVGAMTSGSFASPNNLLGFYENTNASNITALTISYDAERYRINSAAASVQFFYSLNGTTWTAVTAGDIATSSFPTGTSAYNFTTGTVVSRTGISITGLSIATNGAFYLRWNINTTGGSSQGIAIDNVSLTASFTVAATPDITLADNGTVAAANVNQGTTNHVLHKFSLAVATANARLSGITVTTAGNYAAADITNLKVRYSTDATLDAGDATLSTASNPGVAGSKTFPSFTSQAINSGSTGYIFITADIAGTAGAGNTISVNAVTTGQVSFTDGTETGSTSAGGAQTFAAATPVIAIADNGTPIAAANVNQGASNHILSSFKADVTTANATLTKADVYYNGTYVAADIVANGLKLWYNATNNFATASTLGTASSTAAALSGDGISFATLSQLITAGTTGYFWVTASLSATAIPTNTINALGFIGTDFTFSSGTASGSASAGGAQTIVTATPAITLADNGTQVTAGNVNLSAANHVLHKFSLAVTINSATLTGIQITTAGTYTTADLTNLKIRYSTDATLDAGDATLSTYTSVPSAGTLTFPSFANQVITSGTTGFIFITADIAGTAVAGNTIGVNAVTTAQVSFSTGTETGSTTAAGLQTVAVVVGPIWTNPITGTNPGQTSPYIAGQTVDANITVSGIVRGSGIAGTTANDRYNANGWNQSNLDGLDYFEFMLTPNSGYKINLASFVYTGQASGAGPTNFVIRSNIDGFVANIGTATTGTTISLSAAAYQNLVTAVTFQFYAWGGTGGTYSINDFTFNGSVSVAGSTLVTSTATLSSFSYVAGAGPSSSQTFNLSGISLTGVPDNITVSGSTNYEVSTDNTNFFNSRTVAYSSATLAATPIYVRLKSGLLAGTYNGETISISGGGATTVNVTCNGSVIPPFYRSRNTTGNWTTASDWESSADNLSWSTAGQIPTAAATAITIQGTHNMSIASGSVSADDITIAIGGTLTIATGGIFILNNGSASTDLQVDGTLTYSGGTFTQGLSGIAFGTNATYNHALAASAIPIATWDVASTCVVTGATGVIPTNIAQNYGNFTWNCTGQSTFFAINNNAFQVRGLFRLLSTGSVSNTFTMGSTVVGEYVNTINAASIEGGILAIAFTSGVKSTTTITTDLTISGGEVRINGSAGVGTLNVGRDLLMSGTGFLNPMFAATSPSTTITVGRDLIMSGNSFIDFEFTNTASTSSVINVGRNFTSTSAGNTTNFVVLDFGGSTTSGVVAGNTLNIAGNFSYTGTGELRTTSNFSPTGIVFNGSGIQTFTYTTTGTLDWVPITINSGATVQLQNSFSIGESTDAPAANITVNGTLDFQNFSITAFTSSVPRFNTSAGSTLITTNAAGLGGTGSTGSLRGFGTVGDTSPANGKAVFLAGTNYTFNGDTTTPFPNGTIGSAATINVNASLTSNYAAALAVTTALNINGTNVFKLNPANNNSITLSGVLTVAAGATFDNNGTNQITSSGAININGKFITRAPDGFVGSNTAITLTSRSLPTLGSNSTIEYGLAGNQIVQGGTAPTYQNITFSGGGTKTLSSGNNVVGTISILDATTFDAGTSGFGSGGSHITMIGASVYKLGGSGIKPDSGGTYTLGTDSTLEFTGSSATQIRLAPSYAKVIISGTNVKAGSTDEGGITFQNPGSFTVKTNGVFKVTNTTGFTGSATAAIKNTTSPTITLETGSRIEFAGDQVLPATQTITPFLGYSDVGISGTGTKTLANATEVYIGRDLLLFPEATPENTGFLQIDANRLLTVERNILNTSTKDLIIKNSGNLVQVANVDNATTNANTGNIKMTRTSRLMFDNDYIYWGSPVKENVLSQIPTNFDSTYQWDLTGAIDGAWNALSAIVPGRGFITKVASGVTTATNFDFIGTPNNGLVTVTANAYDSLDSDESGNSILLANPYPSAIDATKFVDNLNNSAVISGTLYFWSSSTPNSGGSYATNDYATWNKSGGVDTAPPVSNPSATNLKPSGYIAAGQGFFALLKGDGDVNFTNDMRERATGNNAQFFKTTAANKTKTEKSRVWLNLTNDKNAFRQMLVSYITDATNGLDSMFDGPSFTGNEIDIYSIVENKKLVIQGRALPLDDADIVPLGITITNAGEYTIAIDEVDGLMTNKTIYLEDKLLNKTHNLTTGAYTFNTASGTFNSRFVLRYTNATLASNEFDTLENQVVVYNKNKQIKVSSAIENIAAITVYDLLGRQLFKKDKVNSRDFILSNLVSNQQMLVVKVVLENGKVLTKKVLF